MVCVPYSSCLIQGVVERLRNKSDFYNFDINCVQLAAVTYTGVLHVGLLVFNTCMYWCFTRGVTGVLHVGLVVFNMCMNWCKCGVIHHFKSCLTRV